MNSHEIALQMAERIKGGEDWVIVTPEDFAIVEWVRKSMDKLAKRYLAISLRDKWKNEIVEKFGWAEARFSGHTPTEIQVMIAKQLLIENQAKRQTEIPDFMQQCREAVILKYAELNPF